MPYGLSVSDLAQIVDVLKAFSEIEATRLFGSRAKGNYQRGSDVDLAISGAAATFDTAAQISYQLNEETLLPYFFDVVLYDRLEDPNLRSHIDRVGIQIFSRIKLAQRKEVS